MRTHWRSLLGGLATLGGVTLHIAHIAPAALAAEKGSAVPAFVVGLFQIVNSLFRIRLKHWSSPELRHRLLPAEAAYGPWLVGSGGAAWLIAPHFFSLAALVLLYGVPAISYGVLEQRINAVVDQLGLPRGSERVGETRPYLLTGVDDDLATIARTSYANPFAEAIDHIINQPRAPLSPTRVAMQLLIFAAVMLALVGFSSNASATFINRIKEHSRHERPKHSPPHSRKKPTNDAHLASKPPTAQPPGLARTPVQIRDWWTTRCPTLPGFDAPRWMAPLFYAMYLGGRPDLELGPAPGEGGGGCTGSTIVSSHAGSTFAYTFGVNPDTKVTMSLAVVSAAYGPALYFAPAVKPIMRMIHQGLVVGGPPRLDTVGNGDTYVVNSRLGSWLLVRTQKVFTSDPESAEPYTVLAPPAARALVDAMRAAGNKWLWPNCVHVRHKQTCTLVRSPILRDSVGRITYDDSTDEAIWEYPVGAKVYGAGTWIDRQEIAQLAKSAE